MSPNRFASIARVEFTVGLTARPRDVNPASPDRRELAIAVRRSSQPSAPAISEF